MFPENLNNERYISSNDDNSLKSFWHPKPKQFGRLLYKGYAEINFTVCSSFLQQEEINHINLTRHIHFQRCSSAPCQIKSGFKPADPRQTKLPLRLVDYMTEASSGLKKKMGGDFHLEQVWGSCFLFLILTECVIS